MQRAVDSSWQLHETILCPCLINCSVQLQASKRPQHSHRFFSVAKKIPGRKLREEWQEM